ncbi:hypothetical protein WDW37_15530 [Bdellovibrionota bacterium FG-1]
MRVPLKKFDFKWAIIALQFVALSTSAWSVDIQTHTAPGNSLYMLNESVQPSMEHGPLFLGLDYNLLNDPLVELTPDLSTRTSTIVDSIMTLDLTAGLRLAPRVALNATLPLNLAHPVGEGRSFALGDMRLFAKLSLLPAESLYQFSLIPELRVPTGDSGLFLSNGSVGYGLGAAQK